MCRILEGAWVRDFDLISGGGRVEVEERALVLKVKEGIGFGVFSWTLLWSSIGFNKILEILTGFKWFLTKIGWEEDWFSIMGNQGVCFPDTGWTDKYHLVLVNDDMIIIIVYMFLYKI